LIGARALQGVGAAVVAPTSLSLLTANFPDGRERTRAVAWFGATAGVGASLGLLVGGAAAHWVSWRAGFFINVPIGLAMIVAARRYLSETARHSGRFDVVGAITATLGMGALAFGILHAADAGWSTATSVVALVAGLVLLTALVVNEARVRHPIMPLRLFRSRERSAAYGARMLFLGAMITFFYFTTQYLQGVLGFNPLQAGIGFLPMTLVNFGVALAVPRLTRRIGNSALLAAGVAVTLVGMAWLNRLNPDATYLSAVALPMVVIGAGQGLAFAPLTAAGISRVTADDAGAASGLVNTAHQIGSALGLAVLVSISAHAGSHRLGSAAALADQVGRALTGSAVLLAAALLVSVAFILPGAGMPRRRPAREAGRLAVSLSPAE